MSDSTLTFEITVAAPASAVYRAFTNQSAVTTWLCSTAQVTAQEGGVIFLQWSRPNYYAVGEFTRLKPDRRIAFTWHGRGEPAPTRVKVKLAEQDDGTRVTLAHKKLGSGAKWENVRRQVHEGWTFGLANLKQVLETGLDKRIYDRPFLGIYIAGLVSAEQAARLDLPVAGGIRLNGAVPETGAAALGLQDQDLLVGLDGSPVTDFASLSAVVNAHKAGDSVSVDYYRDGTLHSGTMTFSARPAPNVPTTAADFAALLKQQYDEVAAEFDALFGDVAEADAAYRPEGQWSAKEILAHLLTTERGMHMAIASNMDDQTLLGWPNNVNAWMKAYADAHTLASMGTAFKQSLAETVAIIANLPPELEARQVTYFGIGQTLLGLVGHIRGHYVEMQQAIAQSRAATAPA